MTFEREVNPTQLRHRRNVVRQLAQSLLQQLSCFLGFSLCANEIAAQDSDRDSGGQPAPFIDGSAPSSFPESHSRSEIPRENKKVGTVAGDVPDIAEGR